MDKIIEYFKDNQILGIILLVVAIVLVAIIIWAIAAACKKSGKKKKAAEQPNAAVEETAAPTQDAEETQQALPYEEKPADLNETEKATAEETTAEIPAAAPEAAEPEKELPAAAEGVAETESAVQEEAAEQQPAEPSDQPAKVAAEEKKQAPKKPRKPQSKEALAKIYAGKWFISVSGQNADGTPSYSFELRASNGEKLLSSVNYKSVQGAKNGIKTYKTNIEKDNFTIAQNKKGEFFFRLLNGSGHLLSTGEQYQSKSSCENAIDSVKRFAMTAVIVVEEEE